MLPTLARQCDDVLRYDTNSGAFVTNGDMAARMAKAVGRSSRGVEARFLRNSSGMNPGFNGFGCSLQPQKLLQIGDASATDRYAAQLRITVETAQTCISVLLENIHFLQIDQITAM